MRIERCALCGCRLIRSGGTYARPTRAGRAHATKHHFVAERFFGRSGNRHGTREKIFNLCPWNLERKTDVFCYECHEELLHNPVFLPRDMLAFADLVRRRRLSEQEKGTTRGKIAGRIMLLHEVIEAGIASLSTNRLKRSRARRSAGRRS
jgi:hypothetical protein